MNILISCPPMLGMIDEFRREFEARGASIKTPKVLQTLSVDELCDMLPEFDGWIAGDDPVNRTVLEAGKAGRLRAVVKWGVGVDNVDFEACRSLGIDATYTPRMFGAEVADIAVGYVIGLARQTFLIDREVRDGQWPKPAGISLSGRRAAVIGYGDIGSNITRRLSALGMTVRIYEQGQTAVEDAGIEFANWPDGIGDCDFIVVACDLNDSTHHLIDAELLGRTMPGVRIVNVARGPVIDEAALIDALASEQVHSTALDVFEVEPLPTDSPLRAHPRCIFGSHNASNTEDAVRRTSLVAIDKLFGFLEAK